MPPTTRQVLDALEAMQDAPLASGYKSVAKSAASEIEKLKRRIRRLEGERNGAVERITPMISNGDRT